jgi:hypothetical protein
MQVCAFNPRILSVSFFLFLSDNFVFGWKTLGACHYIFLNKFCACHFV